MRFDNRAPEDDLNPDTPPDSRDPTGLCPRCGRNSSFEPTGEPLPVTMNWAITSHRADGTISPDVITQASALLCRACRQATVVVEEQWIGNHRAADGVRSGGYVNYRGIYWWPPPSSADLDEVVPEQLRASYAEAMRCLAAQAPRASAVMLRRTIESLVDDRGSSEAKDQRTLAQSLQLMAAEGTLDRNLAEWAGEVRLAGNVGAHFDPLDDVTLEEAEVLSRLTRQILHYLYELPAQIRRSRT